MEIQLVKDINIGGKAIAYIISFELRQAFNTHHSFELRFNHDHIGAPGLITLDDSRDLVGKTLTASFGLTTGKQQKFAGVVTSVELTQSHGYHGVIIASGYSPTILIDRGPDLGSYYNKTLAAIVNLVTHDTPANDLRVVSNPDRKKPVDYVMQYRESDFDFLNRLSAEYYEWFFYDGVSLNFGKPGNQTEVALVYGRDIQRLQYGIELAPIKNTRFAYFPQQDQLLQGQSAGNAAGRPDLVHAANTSGTTYSKTFNQPALIRVENNGDIKDLVDNEEKASTSQLLKISGRGDNPEVSIGKIIDVSMSINQGAGFETKSLGKFLVTSVTHSIDNEGRYSNQFEGIVSTAERIPFSGYQRPDPEMLLAEVFDNADPMGQGRVRVKFKWLCETNDPTEWLRVITPDAGSSNKVTKNRGFVFIPEKGDQVVIGFEDGNIARPIVMGSVFHGKNGIGGSSNNDRKSLTTKSGHTLSMDDSGGILVKDKTDLNFIAIDGKNAITVNTDNNITLQTGKVMIIMDKEKDKIIIQAKNIEIRAADDFLLTGDGAPARNGNMEFDEKLQISSQKELSMVGGSTANLNGKDVTITGARTSIDGSPVKINS
ncbi:MAG TPA: phage baseplate assembly protein V [Puia sp.]|nr:phage baseplate assembly protein V [Puia sp.]